MLILNSLIPIFAVIGLGMVLRRSEFLNAETTEGFNRLAYFVALPMFLLVKLGTASSVANANPMMVAILGATLLTGLLGWLVCVVGKLEYQQRGALIQACLRGNLAFIALPLILFVVADLAPELRSQIEAAVFIAMAPVVVFYNVASITALVVFQPQMTTGFRWLPFLKTMLTNPILVGCLAGMLLQWSGTALPVSVVRTCEVVGAAAFPLALLGIGSQLAALPLGDHWRPALLSSTAKCVICPLLGWGIGRLLGMKSLDLQVTVILCGAPTAVSSFVLVDQLGGDRSLAASAVVISTATSLVTLSAILGLTS